ncbi:peptidyl-prolyl cis-trans isomerase FKBP8-like [Littorina saxatilis]|uniref:peptidylprolyl isomerase n=1 Tax=Littorina saxatilis TaxID=31220 RepID=A0AAN9C1U2_9CAEN
MEAVENIGPVSGTGSGATGDQTTNKLQKLPDLVSFEQKVSSDKSDDQIMANGSDPGGEGSTDSTTSPGKNSKASSTEGQQVDSSQTESGAVKGDSESGIQKTDVDVKAEDAATSKEKESDERLESTGEPEDEWMDILGNGQLKKKMLKAGTESSHPAPGSLVTVKVNGRLDSGVCIQDSTENFILGDGDVIAALDMGVALMDEGETAEVVTAPRFAYGRKGREPDIPKDSTLTYNLQLLDVKPGVDFTKLTSEERLQFGEQKRERGNDLFGREDFSGAINSYSKAVTFLDSSGQGLSGDTSILQKIHDSRLKCFNNLAASQLKVGATDAAIRSCEAVLLTQPENIKALYRLGKAFGNKGQTDKAITTLKKALKLDPESKLLHRELASLTQKQKKEVESEKTMYKKMMGSMGGAAEKKDEASSGGVLKWSLVAGGVIAAAASVGLAFYRSTH